MNYIAERRLEEKERRRAEIVDAAEAAGREVGLDSLTMDDVARRARLSRALLYVYFQDRSDLMFGLAERAMQMLHARFVAHAYPPHAHDTWTVFIVDDGAIRYDLDRHPRGAAGAVVSTVKLTGADSGPSRPAASVAVVVSSCGPSPSGAAGVKLQAPEPSAIAVPIGVLLS